MLEQHLGTCMDLTLLYAACLEGMGLHPVMVMMKGHIFAGVWLVEESFSDLLMEDPSQLEKRMSKGIHEITVVECTAMCAGKSRSDVRPLIRSGWDFLRTGMRISCAWT